MKVKDLKAKQLQEMVDIMINEPCDYTFKEFMELDIDSACRWSTTPQGHQYWKNIVGTFNTKDMIEAFNRGVECASKVYNDTLNSVVEQPTAVKLPKVDKDKIERFNK